MRSCTFTPDDLASLAGRDYLPSMVKTIVEAYKTSASRYELTILPLGGVRLVVWESKLYSWQEEPVDCILDMAVVQMNQLDAEKFFKLRSEQVAADEAGLFAGSNI